MKKILLATMLSFLLVGCQTMEGMKEDVKDGVSDIKEDINEGVNDIEEEMDDMKDSNYKYGLNLEELWTVPSFCNATMSTTLFRGY